MAVFFWNSLLHLSIDEKILQIWANHPNRLIVEGKEHFFEKAQIIKDFVEKIIKW